MSVQQLVSSKTRAESRQHSTASKHVSGCPSSMRYRVHGKMGRQVAKEISCPQSAIRSKCIEGGTLVVCLGKCRVELASVRNFPSGRASRPGRRRLGVVGVNCITSAPAGQAGRGPLDEYDYTTLDLLLEWISAHVGNAMASRPMSACPT